MPKRVLFSLPTGEGRGGAFNKPRLQHLCKTVQYLFRRQRLQPPRPDERLHRRSKNSDTVFETAVVEARLAAGRSIHHRQERRRNIDTIDAAFVRRRSKTHNIRQYSAADSDHHAAPRQTMGKEEIPDPLHRLKRLFRFRNRQCTALESYLPLTCLNDAPYLLIDYKTNLIGFVRAQNMR